METNAPNSGEADGDVLTYLEQLWQAPAKAPAHDPQRTGWLVCTSVFALIGCGSAMGAIASANGVPLLVAAASALASAVVVVLHWRARKRRSARWH